ncbi:MAG TPA: hypothetical protein VK533_03335 [Sphingomonas sp.]|uniref:hypothetical protein n=1 Tax=Sphingomonas sp. TaxID=28214 RepID=UPI002CF52156|nr:hypothetical protein [Sphingomonas sp.]HMI18557.1 hypothetical protein [Sphingomonas sp.]
MFDSHEELAAALAESGIECSVAGSFVQLPIEDVELTGTLQIVEGWLVFKVYLGERREGLKDPAYQTLLRLHDRLIGLRFSLADRDFWIVQDFPIAALGNDFAVYLRNAFWVLGAFVPALDQLLSRDTPMSEDEIDAMFQRLEATRLN